MLEDTNSLDGAQMMWIQSYLHESYVKTDFWAQANKISFFSCTRGVQKMLITIYLNT